MKNNRLKYDFYKKLGIFAWFWRKYKKEVKKQVILYSFLPLLFLILRDAGFLPYDFTY